MFGDFAGTIIIRLRRLTEEERSSARPMAKSTSFVESPPKSCLACIRLNRTVRDGHSDNRREGK